VPDALGPMDVGLVCNNHSVVAFQADWTAPDVKPGGWLRATPQRRGAELQVSTNPRYINWLG